MLRKIFSFAQKNESNDPAEKLQIERDLATLAAQIQETQWIALVTSDGLPRGIYPVQTNIHPDRISTMSAALFALGERITRELKEGTLQYSLTVGEEGAIFMIVLSPDYILTLGLNRDVSASSLLVKLRESISPLLETLRVRNLPWL